MPKQIAVLGSTGSIGTQTLEVAAFHGFKVTALSAHSNVTLLKEQTRLFSPRYIAITDENAAKEFKDYARQSGYSAQLFAGENASEALVQQISADEVDIVLNAIVGVAGLTATLAAMERGFNVALANKESLVAGGQLVMKKAKEKGGRLIPVDSEHSAIFQCLQDPYAEQSIKRLILTASGGPFFGRGRKELQQVTSAEALKHPNWEMGPKISIDSATLMNKGLELIEAMWLFDVPCDSIDIVVQTESIIHSMVEFSDHSILAQMGAPDMRLAIQYALTWPKRTESLAPSFDFTKLSALNFGVPDPATFECLQACIAAAKKGGLAPCAANSANEEAVALFLQDKIKFLDIGRLVLGCVNADSYAKNNYTYEDIAQCDKEARAYVHANL